MKTYNIKIANDKSIKCLNGNIICKKGECNIDELCFDVDESLLQYNNFLILNSPTGVTYIDIITSDLKYIIGSFITNEVGTWTIQFLSSTQEDILTQNEIDDEQTIMISNTLQFIVINSLASNQLNIPPTSSNLNILGEELATLYNTFNTLAEDYPQIEDYIEVQEELKVIEDMISNIKVDVGDVTVDNSEVMDKLNEIQNMVGLMSNNVNTIYNTINSIESVTNTINNKISEETQIVETIDNNVKNIIDKSNEDSIAHDAYWSLVRSEEVKIITNEILTKVNSSSGSNSSNSSGSSSNSSVDLTNIENKIGNSVYTHHGDEATSLFVAFEYLFQYYLGEPFGLNNGMFENTTIFRELTRIRESLYEINNKL